MTDQPHIFNKTLRKSVCAAETVLGPQAVRLVVDVLFNNTVTESGLGHIMNYLDPRAQLKITTDGTGNVLAETEPVHDLIGDTVDGFTLVDLKTAIAHAIKDDLTGFVLQAIQYKWERELTIEDAENITFHLHKLMGLLK